MQLRMYDFPLGDVCLEECLVPDRADDGYTYLLYIVYYILYIIHDM